MRTLTSIRRASAAIRSHVEPVSPPPRRFTPCTCVEQLCTLLHERRRLPSSRYRYRVPGEESLHFFDIDRMSCLNGWTCGNIAPTPLGVASYFYDLFNGKIIPMKDVALMRQWYGCDAIVLNVWFYCLDFDASLPVFFLFFLFS